jgi:hypothetical protein
MTRIFALALVSAGHLVLTGAPARAAEPEACKAWREGQRLRQGAFERSL